MEVEQRTVRIAFVRMRKARFSDKKRKKNTSEGKYHLNCSCKKTEAKEECLRGIPLETEAPMSPLKCD